MKTKDAVEYVLADQGLSQYRLAQLLGMAGGVSVSQWRNAGVVMSSKTAEKFKELFDIEVTDAFDPYERPERGRKKNARRHARTPNGHTGG